MNYVIKTILQEALGLTVHLFHEADAFLKSSNPKINYSEKNFGDIFQIKPHGILFDHGIQDYPIEVHSNTGYVKVFMVNNGKDIPFDLFGAAFWLLSRFEEHLPHKADQYNRFSYRSSLAYQQQFIQLPLINVWLDVFKSALKVKYPSLQFRELNYRYLSTIDIDNAFQYKFKGFVRTLAGIVSDKSWRKTKDRIKIIMGLKQDPYDCYDFLLQTHRELHIDALFFILLGDYGPNDKNHSASDLRFQALIKHIKDYAMVGIHPSFGSNKTVHQLMVEVHRLSSITHASTTHSRQHYSMLTFPDTYRHLLQAGIHEDYSMGYTNHNGFRASYCYPFKWYSLENESITPLVIHPFCISENTLLSQSKNNHAQMMKDAKFFVDEVKKYKGECISIFHNDNFDKDLNAFYFEFVKMAAKPD